jgi:uncharacterized protein DUF5995
MPLEHILKDAPVRSIGEAISVMAAIDETLPDGDGVKWFNRLYLRVTTSVQRAVQGAVFRDPRFLSELDVVFANLYFTALASCVLWGLAAVPLVRDEFFGRLDSLVGMNSRALLLPIDRALRS